jgi:hypothetical protein
LHYSITGDSKCLKVIEIEILSKAGCKEAEIVVFNGFLRLSGC